MPREHRPRTAAGRAGLAAVLAAARAQPRGGLIALDYDGTLAPIVADPAAAVPARGACELLGRLARAGLDVAIVTGRPAADVVGLARLAELDAPGLAVRGLYGRQRWDARAGLQVPPAHPGVAAARAELTALLAAASAAASPSASPPLPAASPAPGRAGLRLEDKGGSLAVHARGAPDPDAALAAIAAGMRGIAAAHGLELASGRAVLELLPPGPDKGTALTELVEQLVDRLAGRPGALLYAGDDVGDLPAFAALEALRGRGIPGLTVAVASAESPAVAARADLVVPSPAALVDLLSRLADAPP